MGEDSFFDALYHIMWDMETDIFSEEKKTLALLADLVPKCKKQRRRIKAMYDCGTMDYIEKAVADHDNTEYYLNIAVRQLVKNFDVSPDKALFAVNNIVELWDGDVSKLKEYDEEDESEFYSDDDEYEEQEGDDDNMFFVQDVAVEENKNEETQEEQDTQEEQSPDGGDAEPKINIIKNLLISWCCGDCEEGRPYMIACPVGWVLLILCSLLGVFLVYDIFLGDKFVIPTFAFIFTLLTAKRLYRFESAGRFSLLVAAFYIIAMLRVIWEGIEGYRYGSILLVCASLIIFNNGRISTWLDESKKSSVIAYLIITVFSALITAGAYALQNVTF